MAQSNTRASATRSVLAEIVERLAALTPDRFVEPEQGPEKSYHAVGEADDDLKRLFTLRSIACDEHNALGKSIKGSMNKLEKTFENAQRTRSAKALADALQALASFEEDAETVRIRFEMAQKRKFHAIVDSVFWLQLRRQYPELLDKPCVSIRKNWTVGWIEEDDNEELNDAGGSEMPEELLEFLRASTR